ncbi:MAG TPA: PP2C family protein-serine/threonine phosphatase [Thermoanaerobaculia bacterium]|nr:PP2C family protein-serine/threonine phosphatase [Thermoanaerobaculia bacterium]
MLLLVWGFPRAFPFAARDWQVTREEAIDLALERLRDLGEPVEDPYIVAWLDSDSALERRLQLALRDHDAEWLWKSGLPAQVRAWEVYVYPSDALRDDWTYVARVSLSGDVHVLRLRLDPQLPGAPISPQQARDRADAFLAEQGIDVSRYGEPQVRTLQLSNRTDTTVRYPDRIYKPWEKVTQGIAVAFSGDRLVGMQPWLEDPEERQLQRTLRPVQFTSIAWLMVVILLSVMLALPFLKRYHEGEVGVRRSAQIFLLVAGCGLLLSLLTMRGVSQGVGMGLVSRAQTSWLWALFVVIFNVFPIALVGFFAWAVGESICRERWGRKLAAFDALFQKEWGNATVARASLIGWMAGLLAAGGTVAMLVALRRWDAWALFSYTQGFQSRWPGLEVLLSNSYVLPAYMTAVLCVLPGVGRRLGIVAGGVAAVLEAMIAIPPPVLPLPLGHGLPVLLFMAAVPALLFLAYDLLTVLTAGVVFNVVLGSYPLLTAADPSLQFQGAFALALVAAPLLASVRYLGSDKEFVYRYEDIPPHVRRIADRERQRVELETARRIQSSILPELPPRLSGVDIAHAYLPASEVGGDFYDVLALEDGRLAVAVGDVAGHGVSSGLVMSMAKSALAVQVTFDPDVAAVFRTLNRVVHQTARKRLLATLCYALLDPKRLELLYASAGHLYPYRITAAGKVDPLESTAYPLGVRGILQVEPRTARLQPGDSLFLFSDGLVEARADGSEEQFGFERLEQSLARHAPGGVEAIRDGVLADVDRFTRHAPREDDQTILVLRLP